ncbi:hypothetical protein [Motiliproteus sp. SC1-56]|uniref:hypothetical protein n=1 Tax=Motiliproteus sp. SC1-56 TaxID=2799565 RepID=UPI001A8D4741|nr:hypothetical protein [Motiliproteus sp. SC1-56]
MSNYLTAAELSERIKFNPKYISQVLRDTVFIEGTHYVRPFGGRKILYLWDAVEAEILKPETRDEGGELIPMARGGVCHG